MKNDPERFCDLKNLKTTDTFVWELISQVSTRLQIFSTSAKTGVTSLMDHNILFDNSTQFAILEEIDKSIDQIGKFGIVLSILSRIEAQKLRVNIAYHSLQELFISLNRSLEKSHLGKSVHINYFEDDLFAYIDLEYITIACILLFEAILESGSSDIIQVEILEDHKCYSIVIKNVPQLVTDIFIELTNGPAVFEGRVPPLILLNLYAFCRLLDLVNVQLHVSENAVKLTIENNAK
jgi:K+-sensing histidine kinase KdpD